MLTTVSIPQLQALIDSDSNILCGAGVSMIEPTRLPSGNRLRDLCVRGLLADRANTEFIDRLQGSPGYQRLLPEAVLQEVGLFASSHVDNLMASILAEARPNSVHGEIATRFAVIFTTNFDSCFERSGAQRVVHLHGAIDDPRSLQNRVFRLGKGRDQDIDFFESNVRGRPLVVVGYSFRDEDVIESIARARPEPILFLSHDGDIPPYLASSEASSFTAAGSAEELFSARVPAAGRSRESLREVSIRRPSVGARASALLFLVYLAGLYELAPEVLDLYLPRLTGRTRYKAICSAADSLRILGRYTEAIELCQKVIASRFCRRPDQVDQLATVNNLMALCELDRGDDGYESAEFHFRQALEYLQQYQASHLNSSNAVGIEIFRARITNNLGILYTNRGEYQRATTAYHLSRAIKLAHHDDRGIAQTDSNLAKCYLKMLDYSKASHSLREVVRRMTKAPDRYICKDAVDEILPLLCEGAKISVTADETRGGADDETWAKLEGCISASNDDASRILRDLRELDRLRREVYKG